MNNNPANYQKLKFYQGDIHNHCGLSYGRGALREAIKNAKTQLDFVSVTLHAAWPDMPIDDPDLDYLIAYHQYGFNEAVKNWPDYLQQVESFHDAGKFVTFPSYEWHSSQYGDHCVYFKSPQNQPILSPSNLADLKTALQDLNSPCLVIPHHIAYQQGYRGIQWDTFSTTLSPVVEIFSFHGASERCAGPYPYLHSMGPRDGNSCAQYGWKQGHIFGVVGSTDHHNAFPGSYGRGRMGVWADSLTRDGIWEAIQNRRTVALTGDRIQLKFSLNGQPMGAVCSANELRKIHLSVLGSDRIDVVDILHNNEILQRVCPLPNQSDTDRFKFFFEMGWGEKQRDTIWQAEIKVYQGKILNVEPHFRGYNGKDFPEEDNFAYAGYSFQSPETVHITTRTRPNPTPHTPATEGVVLELQGDENTQIHAKVNEQAFQHSLGELVKASRTHHLSGFVSPAICFHKAVPQSDYQLDFDFTHQSPANSRDWYYVRVRQENGQMAWSSPIWVGKTAQI